MRSFSFNLLFLVLISLNIYSCKRTQPSVYLTVGTQAGDISQSTAIIQTRLCADSSYNKTYLKGIKGHVVFEIDTSAEFIDPQYSKKLLTDSTKDYIVKYKFNELKPATRYFYRVKYGVSSTSEYTGKTQSFKTLGGRGKAEEYSFAAVTGMNYYFHYYGKYDSTSAFSGTRKNGYPALKTMIDLNPDYFIGTGDNVYFDHPAEKNFRRNKMAYPGDFNGMEVKDIIGIRKKYHQQFSQPLFRELFSSTGTYWMKDDHDYRFNDADKIMEHPISHTTGISSFLEQMPVNSPTYRTRRVSKDLQLWFVENRDYRSPNSMKDGKNKSIWGQNQKSWLKRTLLESDAKYKILVSPTPMVGPDDAYKSDNQTNEKGFKYEGEEFFRWLDENNFDKERFFIICGDRHWQYHAIHPSGYQEFSTGALADNNSRAGRVSGDPKSTDPDSTIIQKYIQSKPSQATGGFLLFSINEESSLSFNFYDDAGSVLYSVEK